MEVFEKGENKASDIYSIDFHFICRICLRRGNLRLFEQEDYLLDLFVTITKIDVRSTVNFPSNICSECINELKDISLFIDISKYNDSRPEKKVIPKKEIEYVAIVDFGTFQEPEVKAEKTTGEYEEDICIEKSEMCQICLVPSCLTPFEEKVHLMQLFQNITNIDLRAASNFSSRNRICNKCINKLESISLFISLSLSNNMKIASTIGRNESLKTENCSEENAIDFSASKGNDMKFDNISDRKEVKVENYFNDSVYSYESKDLHTFVDIKEEILPSPVAADSENDQKSLELCSQTESDPCEKEFSGENHPKIISKGLGVSSEASSRTKQFECNFCKKSFSQKQTLKVHMLTHTGEKPFECDSCGKSFNQKSSLKTHVRLHTGENPFKCHNCNTSFSRKSHLRQHMLIHTGEKPFRCEICQKCSRRKSDLIKHMVTHTGEKPFKCGICQKGFNRKGDLIRHMLTHTGEKPFKCDVCQKCSRRKSDLMQHMLTHTAEK